MGICILTLYTFSTENWQRPQTKVASLMRLVKEYATRELPELQRNGICLRLMGRREGLPDADLIIRTGGEWRLSNLLLWHAVRAVFWSTPILWPDSQREHLRAAIQVYQEQSGGNHV